MADETNTTSQPTVGADAPAQQQSSAGIPIGKQFKGDNFPAIKTPAQVEQESAEQAKMSTPDAVPLEVYFTLRGITDPGAMAARMRYTSLRSAPLEEWDAIFEKAF